METHPIRDEVDLAELRQQQPWMIDAVRWDAVQHWGTVKPQRSMRLAPTRRGLASQRSESQEKVGSLA
jgi:hypothetical protein